MTQADLTHFRELLLERRRNLNSWLDTASGIPQEDIQKARGLLGQVVEALRRVEEGAYGVCQSCHTDIERHRLEVQPVVQVCLGCISPEEQAQLEQELFLASKIHRALLPQTIARIDGFDVAVRSLAARYVGGDYYDFLSANGHGMNRIVIGDAMGKGIPAGLLMSNVQGALRILAEDIASPAQLVERLNRWLCRNVPITKFISLVCLGITPGATPEARLVYANAGHCPPLILRSTGEIEQLESTGGILGVHEDFRYSEASCVLYPHDLLILYTDGIVECEERGGAMYGEERLVNFVSSHRSRPLQEMLDLLVDDVLAYAGKPESVDDLTLIAIRKL